MRNVNLARLAALVLGTSFVAQLTTAVAADTTLNLVSGVTITIPDGISYAASVKGGIKRSPDGHQRSVADGLYFQGEAMDGDEDVDISVHAGNDFLGGMPSPRANGFPLEKLAEVLERKASRGADGATAKRTTLVKTKLSDDLLVIDHQFDVVVDAKPEKSARHHYVLLFYGNKSSVLDIVYPLANEQKWGAAMKGVAASFQPAP